MLDFSHIPSQYPNADIQVFCGYGNNVSESLQTWVKPRGKSMCHIFAVGAGGRGGTGVIGANSTAAGGGGGGSGGQVTLKMPLHLLPNVLYVCAPLSGNSVATYVLLHPDTAVPAAIRLVQVNYGAPGGNASGATAGTAGVAATAVSGSGMPLGYGWVQVSLAGQAGTVGGTTVDGSNLLLPTSGLVITGGTGGGGLGAAGLVTKGGRISASGSNILPTTTYPDGGRTATTPPGPPESGSNALPGGLFYYGGRGGGSTHGSATGAGLVQSSGGDGAPGCGGGGTGGALTGSSAGTVGEGGPGLVIITCW